MVDVLIMLVFFLKNVGDVYLMLGLKLFVCRDVNVLMIIDYWMYV